MVLTLNARKFGIDTADYGKDVDVSVTFGDGEFVLIQTDGSAYEFDLSEFKKLLVITTSD